MTDLTKPFLELADEMDDSPYSESQLSHDQSRKAIRTLVAMLENCKSQRDAWIMDNAKYPSEMIGRYDAELQAIADRK